MSWNPVQEEPISPLTPRVRRPSQIQRKPVGSRHASLEVAHVASYHGRSFADAEGVSPVSRLSSGRRSTADRVTSSYFSPDSIQFSRPVPNGLGTIPIPFLDLDANEAEIQTEQAIHNSNRRSTLRRESEIGARRNSSVYSEQGLGANDYPFFGMSADEAAYLASSAVTSEVGSLHRGLEQSIIDARQQHELLQAGLGQVLQDQIMREATLEQRTDWVMLEPLGSSLDRPGGTGHSGGASKWLPISLRWWFMACLFVLSLGLGLATLVLTLHSHNHQGLATERNTAAFLFTWKFVPTLLAVIYTILVMTIINDIKRTEPYARLSRPAGAPASTLFLRPGPLWSDPFTSLRKPSNGGIRNWALFWAAFVSILSLLLIVPFSAAFIYPAEVISFSSSTFSRLTVSANGPLELLSDDSILFRTISSELLNTTTSAWVSNSYAVQPFWPSNEKTVPLGGVLSSSSQQWTANTTVYEADLECNTMSLRSFANFTITPTTGSSSTSLLSFVIGSDDGCSLGLAALPPESGPSTIFTTGGGWWSGAPNFDYPLFWAPGNGTAGGLNADHPILLNTTSQCGNRSIFFLAEPYVQNQTFRAAGQVCSSGYFSASLPVTVSNADLPPSVTFDTKVFQNARQPISSNVFDISTFENSFLSQNWATKFQSSNSSLNPDLPIRPKLGGPLSLLGAENSFNLPEMLANPNLTVQARQIKQRFLGESMMSSFSLIGAHNAESIAGTSATAERRIVVSFAVGIVLTVAMLLSTCMLLLVAFHTRPYKRPLNLLQDPSSIKGMASLISSRPDIRSLFEGTDRASEYAMRHKLTGYVLYLRNGELHAYGMNDISQLSTGVYSDAGSLETNTWCPEILRNTTTRVFLASTIIIALILAVLFGVFHATAISHSLLLTGSKLDYTDRTVAALAPYDVIPTLICLGIMICWSSMVTTIRLHQPYVSMAKKDTLSPRNPPSYISNILLWTLGSAAWNREYLLSVVAVCGILSQVLTVAISGLWERNPAFQTQSVTALRSAELRTVPAIFTVVSPSTPDAETTNPEGVLSNIFDNSLTSWMFSSVNQGVYNSTPPSWTSEDWAFAPVNLTSFRASSDNTTGKGTLTVPPATKTVTVQAPALRGRLECMPIDMSNTTAWLTTLNLTDKTVWNDNRTGNLTVGYEIKLGFSPNDSVEGARVLFNLSAADYQMPSTGPNTNYSEEATIGYWTHASDDPHASIVVQWITGYPIPYQLRNSTPPSQQTRWIWKDVPKVTALSCVPFFESAIASISVDLASGAVQNYTITNSPSADLYAWSSKYQALNVSTGVPYSSGPNGGAGFQSKPGIFLQNVSVSYGYLFHDIILGAANAARIGAIPGASPAIADNITDRTFSFRLPNLSTDFMSYTSLALSGNNKSALLDPATLGNVSSTVFSLFFKNFVQAKASANDALFIDGTWGLQPLGATVPSDLGPIANSNPALKLQNSLQPSNTNSTIDGVLSTKVENVDINHTVSIICLCILSILIVTIVVIMVCRRRYLQDLPRDMDTVGSVLGLVYGSERLLKIAGENVGETEQHAQRTMLKLGWFEVGHKRRWGVEVVYPGDRFSKEFLGADRGFKEIRLSN